MSIQKMIESTLPRLFAVCILPLWLAVPALGTAASPANLAAQADDLPLPLISSIVDPPEILIPKPPPLWPPPPYQGTTAMEQTA